MILFKELKMSKRENYNEYMRTYMLKRYHERRNWAINYLGGKCAECGTVENLEIDHVDKSAKEINLARQLNSISKEKFKQEIAKCQLLCRACHTKKSIRDMGNRKAQHGSLTMYKYHKCRCDLCKKANTEYTKKYRENH